jgi:hypothetical protein
VGCPSACWLTFKNVKEPKEHHSVEAPLVSTLIYPFTVLYHHITCIIRALSLSQWPHRPLSICMCYCLFSVCFILTASASVFFLWCCILRFCACTSCQYDKYCDVVLFKCLELPLSNQHRSMHYSGFSIGWCTRPPAPILLQVPSVLRCMRNRAFRILLISDILEALGSVSIKALQWMHPEEYWSACRSVPSLSCHLSPNTSSSHNRHTASRNRNSHAARWRLPDLDCGRADSCYSMIAGVNLLVRLCSIPFWTW